MNLELFAPNMIVQMRLSLQTLRHYYFVGNADRPEVQRLFGPIDKLLEELQDKMIELSKKVYEENKNFRRLTSSCDINCYDPSYVTPKTHLHNMVADINRARKESDIEKLCDDLGV